MGFDWDRWKARRNLSLHGVSFGDAASIFDDPLAAERLDVGHSNGEVRWQRTGLSKAGELLVVTFTVRGDTIRIISARRATKRERHGYEG